MEEDFFPTTEELDAVDAAKNSHIYEVKPGDTLSDIAKFFGKTVEEFTEQNKIKNPNRIFPGQKFAIPGREPPPPTPEQLFAPEPVKDPWNPANLEGLSPEMLMAEGDHQPTETEETVLPEGVMPVSQTVSSKNPAVEVEDDGEFIRANFIPMAINDKTGERQLALPKVVYDAVLGFKDVLDGKIPMWVTDQQTGESHINPEAIGVATAISGLSMTGGLAGTGGTAAKASARQIAKMAQEAREAVQSSPAASNALGASVSPARPTPTPAMEKRLQSSLRARLSTTQRKEMSGKELTEEGLDWGPGKVYNLSNLREVYNDPKFDTNPPVKGGPKAPEPTFPERFTREFIDAFDKTEPTFASGLTKKAAKPDLSKWKVYGEEAGSMTMEYTIDSKTGMAVNYDLNRIEDSLTAVVNFSTAKDGQLVGMADPVGMTQGSKVLGSVVDSVRQFMGAAKPQRLMFAAGHPRLDPLYGRLAQQLAKEFGGKVMSESEHGVAGFYILNFPKSKKWFKSGE